jgi:hypothetical protein
LDKKEENEFGSHQQQLPVFAACLIRRLSSDITRSRKYPDFITFTTDG